MQIFQDRQALHRIPEWGLDLPKTTAYVTRSLEQRNCQVFHPIPSSVCAFFDFGAERTIAFRADMDALPIQEKTGLSFASEHAGAMHACGHDGHTAVLLELARRLEHKKLDRNVLLIFQPGEESPGGARPLCETGVLEKYHVEAIFALHLWPGLEKGVVHSRVGEMMSRASELTVTVTGKSAHIGKAEEALDAMAAAVRFYEQAIAMEQAIDPAIYRLLKFGRMCSGTARNIVSAETVMEGSLRAFDDGIFEQMKNALYTIAQNVEKETGCSVTLQLSEGYPVVYNPKAVWDKVTQILPVRHLEKPSLITEDFSYYQRRIPGMLFFMGLGDTPALHTNTFNFDETLLLKGVELFELLAEQYR